MAQPAPSPAAAAGACFPGRAAPPHVAPRADVRLADRRLLEGGSTPRHVRRDVSGVSARVANKRAVAAFASCNWPSEPAGKLTRARGRHPSRPSARPVAVKASFVVDFIAEFRSPPSKRRSRPLDRRHRDAAGSSRGRVRVRSTNAGSFHGPSTHAWSSPRSHLGVPYGRRIPGIYTRGFHSPPAVEKDRHPSQRRANFEGRCQSQAFIFRVTSFVRRPFPRRRDWPIWPSVVSAGHRRRPDEDHVDGSRATETAVTAGL